MSPPRSKVAVSLSLLLALTAAFAALSAACNDDDTPTPTYFIGTNDAAPPRLGPADAGTE